MIELLLGIAAGYIAGVALAHFNPEEVQPGKKYFLWLKRVLLIIILAAIIFYFYQEHQWWLAVLFSVMGMGFFLAEVQFKKKMEASPARRIGYECSIYGISIMAYVLNSNDTFHLVLSSLVLLYGLPTGTWLQEHETPNR